MFSDLYNSLMFFIYDHLLDDLWAMVPTGYRQPAARTGFHLAFIVVWDNPSEDEPTLTSKPRRSK